MMDFITAPLVVGFICLGIYALFELFVPVSYTHLTLPTILLVKNVC